MADEGPKRPGGRSGGCFSAASSLIAPFLLLRFDFSAD
jgi:hypothetical protein